jgi:hypothetical protein
MLESDEEMQQQTTAPTAMTAEQRIAELEHRLAHMSTENEQLRAQGFLQHQAQLQMQQGNMQQQGLTPGQVDHITSIAVDAVMKSMQAERGTHIGDKTVEKLVLRKLENKTWESTERSGKVKEFLNFVERTFEATPDLSDKNKRTIMRQLFVGNADLQLQAQEHVGRFCRSSIFSSAAHLDG